MHFWLLSVSVCVFNIERKNRWRFENPSKLFGLVRVRESVASVACYCQHMLPWLCWTRWAQSLIELAGWLPVIVKVYDRSMVWCEILPYYIHKILSTSLLLCTTEYECTFTPLHHTTLHARSIIYESLAGTKKIYTHVVIVNFISVAWWKIYI